MKKRIPSNLKPASIGKATLSFLLDLAFTAGLMVLLYYTAGVGIAKASGYDAIETAEKQMIARTHLVDSQSRYYDYSDTSETKPEDYAYKKYIDLVWDYFTITVPNDGEFSAAITVTSTIDTSVVLPAYRDAHPVMNQEYGKFLYVNYFGYVEGSTDNYFVPSIANDFTSKPKAGKNEVEYHNALLASMYTKASYSGHYANACRHLANQPAMAKYESRLRNITYISTIPTFTAPAIIFFFIIPIIIPNGRTLGKLICKTAVVGFDGYTARKPFIVIRQFIITMMWLILALPWTLVGVPLTIFLMLLTYMSHVMSKTSRSFVDLIAGTISVDARASVWFASEEELNGFVKDHPTSPISKAILAQRREAAPTTASVVTSAMIAAEEQILDSSTINRRREEARRMTSFDEFERESDADFAAREAEANGQQPAQQPEPEPEVDEAALGDLAAMEGLTPEEAAALADEVAAEEASGEQQEEKPAPTQEEEEAFADDEINKPTKK